jgi:hypothetical protein
MFTLNSLSHRADPFCDTSGGATMLKKSTDPAVLTDRDGIHVRQDGTDGIRDDAATSARAGRLAARLAGSDLDPASLELITAALTAEICAEIASPDASPEPGIVDR